MTAVATPTSSPAPPLPAATEASPRWLTGIFLANLVAQTAIVLTGGLVRVTGSGLGCPTWPQCTEGSLVPTATQTEAWHKYVEFGNRTLTGVLGLLALAAIVGAIVWQRRSGVRRRPIVWLATIPLVGTVAQAVLGGITVLTGLNPVTVALHFLLSAVIIAGIVVLVWRSREPGDTPVTRLGPTAVRILARVLVAVGFLVLILGTIVTGSGPHSGDADAASRFGFDVRVVSWLHADAVLLFIGLTIGLLVALSVTDAPRGSVRAVWWVFGISMVQGVIGYTQYFTGVPWLLVALHMLAACLLWIALVRVPLTLRTRGAITG
ncbi:MAG: heme A synthase [Candidatus Nanopelagicales bacterium]